MFAAETNGEPSMCKRSSRTIQATMPAWAVATCIARSSRSCVCSRSGQSAQPTMHAGTAAACTTWTSSSCTNTAIGGFWTLPDHADSCRNVYRHRLRWMQPVCFSRSHGRSGFGTRPLFVSADKGLDFWGMWSSGRPRSSCLGGTASMHIASTRYTRLRTLLSATSCNELLLRLLQEPNPCSRHRSFFECIKCPSLATRMNFPVLELVDLQKLVDPTFRMLLWPLLKSLRCMTKQ